MSTISIIVPVIVSAVLTAVIASLIIRLSYKKGLIPSMNAAFTPALYRDLTTMPSPAVCTVRRWKAIRALCKNLNENLTHNNNLS